VPTKSGATFFDYGFDFILNCAGLTLLIDIKLSGSKTLEGSHIYRTKNPNQTNTTPAGSHD